MTRCAANCTVVSGLLRQRVGKDKEKEEIADSDLCLSQHQPPPPSPQPSSSSSSTVAKHRFQKVFDRQRDGGMLGAHGDSEPLLRRVALDSQHRAHRDGCTFGIERSCAVTVMERGLVRLDVSGGRCVQADQRAHLMT